MEINMKRILLVLTLVFLLFGSAWSTGFLRSNNNTNGWISFPLTALDTLRGNPVRPDSFHVMVWFDSSAANTAAYSARGSIDSTWIDSLRVGGVTYFYFRNAVAKINGSLGNGYYEGVVYAWAQGKSTPNRFSFQVIDNDTTFSGFLRLLDAQTSSRSTFNPATTGVFLLATGLNADTGWISAKAKLDAAISSMNVWTTAQRDSCLHAMRIVIDSLFTAGELRDTLLRADSATYSVIAGTVGRNIYLGIGGGTGSYLWVQAQIDSMLHAARIVTESLVTAGELRDTLLRADSATYAGVAHSVGRNIFLGISTQTFPSNFSAMKISSGGYVSPNFSDINGTLDSSEVGSSLQLAIRRWLWLNSDSANFSGTANTMGRNVFLGIGGGSGLLTQAQIDSLLFGKWRASGDSSNVLLTAADSVKAYLAPGDSAKLAAIKAKTDKLRFYGTAPNDSAIYSYGINASGTAPTAYENARAVIHYLFDSTFAANTYAGYLKSRLDTNVASRSIFNPATDSVIQEFNSKASQAKINADSLQARYTFSALLPGLKLLGAVGDTQSYWYNSYGLMDSMRYKNGAALVARIMYVRTADSLAPTKTIGIPY
jgi:hypothetical protein